MEVSWDVNVVNPACVLRVLFDSEGPSSDAECTAIVCLVIFLL